MSDSQIPLQIGSGINPWPTMKSIAETAQTGAQTGLIGQQTRAAEIQNALAQLRVGALGQKLGIGIPGIAPGGGSQHGGAGPQGQGQLAPGMGASGQPIQGPYGAVKSSMFGVTVPDFEYMMAISDPTDPIGKEAELVKNRARILAQSASRVTNGQEWNQALGEQYHAGYISPDEYAQHYFKQGMPDSFWQNQRDATLKAAADPNTHLDTAARLAGNSQAWNQYGQAVPSAGLIGGKAAQAGAVAGAEVQPHVAEAAGKAGVALTYAEPTAAATERGAGLYKTTQVTIPDPDHPGQYRTDTVSNATLPNYLNANPKARQASGADLANANVTLSPAAYSGRVTQRENGGGAPGATNAASSAMGNGQFLTDTWRQLVAAAKPAWAQGMTDQQLLAARGDRQKAAEMSYAYAQQNAPLLERGGVPVNSLTLGLAHQFGPSGAVNIMHAAPETPVAQLVPPMVLAANPDLARATAGQLMSQAFRTYGVNSVDLNQPSGAAAPPTTIAPGSAPGLPKLTPAGEAGLQVTQKAIDSDEKDVKAALDSAAQSQSAQTQLMQVRNLLPAVNAGSWATARQTLQNYFATFGPDAANRFVSALTAGNIDPSKAAATSELVKLTVQQAGMAERQALGARGGYNAMQLYLRSFPNIEMQPTAIADMTNLLLVAHQRDVDYAQGASSFFQNNRDAFTGGGQYNSKQKYDQEFLQSNAPQVYVGAAAALNKKPFAEWAHGLTPGQQAEALRIMWRADPGAVVTAPDGRQIRNGAVPAQ